MGAHRSNGDLCVADPMLDAQYTDTSISISERLFLL